MMKAEHLNRKKRQGKTIPCLEFIIKRLVSILQTTAQNQAAES